MASRLTKTKTIRTIQGEITLSVFCTVAVCTIRTASGAFFGISFAVTIHFWAVQTSKLIGWCEVPRDWDFPPQGVPR